MLAHFLTNVLSVLAIASSISLQAHAYPLSTSRVSIRASSGALNFTDWANGNITCYQGQYITGISFAQVLRTGCQKLAGQSVSTGSRAWTTVTSIHPAYSSSNSSSTSNLKSRSTNSSPGSGSPTNPGDVANPSVPLTFAPQDPNAGKKAKVDMYLANVGQGSGETISFGSEDDCSNAMSGILQKCINPDGNTGGGIWTDGVGQIYADAGPL